MSAERPVRALVVDDSTTARALLVAMLERDDEIEVVGEAADGAAAVTMVATLRPSVVVMDIEMPGIDGFEATKRIMIDAPTPIVIVTAHHDPRDVAVTMQAMQMGALTVLPKPDGPEDFERRATELASLVKALADVKVVRRRFAGPPEPPRVSPGGNLEMIAVGASTGGPAALHRFLGALPTDLGAPVVVVQHIAGGFVPGLVRWLGGAARLPVMLAEDGARLEPGAVHIAPDGFHLEVTSTGRAALTTSPPVGGFRPSVSTLFTSVAKAFGRRAAAVVLTGMGSDGLDGTRAVRARHGLVLAQDERTSTVFGMPKVVIGAGLADVVGPVEDLAAALADRCAARGRPGAPTSS